MKPTKHPTFSLIICLYVVTERFFRDLERFANLVNDDWELIIVTEKDTDLSARRLPYTIVRANTKPISLSEKRDLGFKVAKGRYAAFIDDDAYPDPQWLVEAEKIFRANPKIGAVGGPNITAPDDPFWAKIGGYIYESYLTSAKAQFRFLPMKRRTVMELQGVNLIIRSDILKELGGFNSHLSSGDDSKICSDIRGLGYKIIYDPKVAVYHHRRPFPVAHLKQIRNMGRHRGFFVKAYPDTLTPIYFAPALLAVAFIAALIISIIEQRAMPFFLGGLLLAYIASWLSVVKQAGPYRALFAALGVILTHIVYGLSFIHGLTLAKIER